MADESTKRIYADVPQELYDRLEKKIPWGFKSAVWLSILSATADFLDDGNAKIYHILEGDVEIIIKSNVRPPDNSESPDKGE